MKPSEGWHNEETKQLAEDMLSAGWFEELLAKCEDDDIRFVNLLWLLNALGAETGETITSIKEFNAAKATAKGSLVVHRWEKALLGEDVEN